MKSLFLFIVLSFVPSISFGQIFVGKVDINKDESIRVIEVFIYRGMSRKSIRVYVDFGQKDNAQTQNLIMRNDDMLITDPETQEKKVFISTAAVLNFFENQNWEHYNGLVESIKGDSGFYYYFRKRSSI